MKRNLLIILLFVTQICFAQNQEKVEKPEKDNLDFLDKIDYPELQVVPRASERVEGEAQVERDGGSWINQWTFILSGSTTLLSSTFTNSAIPSQTADQSNGIKLAQLVGAMTLGVGIYYGATRP